MKHGFTSGSLHVALPGNTTARSRLGHATLAATGECSHHLSESPHVSNVAFLSSVQVAKPPEPKLPIRLRRRHTLAQAKNSVVELYLHVSFDISGRGNRLEEQCQHPR